MHKGTLKSPQKASQSSWIAAAARLRKLRPVPRRFYDRSPELVAPELLGKVLIRRQARKLLAGRIVEVRPLDSVRSLPRGQDRPRPARRHHSSRRLAAQVLRCGKRVCLWTKAKNVGAHVPVRAVLRGGDNTYGKVPAPA